MEKLATVRFVEALNHGVAPGLGYWDEHRLDAKVQAHPDDQTRGARIAVAAAKAQFVVKEQKIRKPDDFPAAQQAAGNLPILFGALGLDIDLVAIQVDHVE